MNAHQVVTSLRGQWSGSYGMVSCPLPSHGKGKGDKSPSLKVSDSDDGIRVHCFSGCDWRDVRDELRRRGLLPEGDDRRQHQPRRSGERDQRHQDRDRPQDPDPDELKRIEAARRIVIEARPIEGTPAATYLREPRGINIALPPTLRFAYLPHKPTGLVLPCLVAAVQGPDGEVRAVHRTYLRGDGDAKAPVSKPKLALGPVSGGAVRLGPAGTELGLCEGIETGLSVMQLYTDTVVWCCLGGANIKNVILPDTVEHVVIYGDNGDAGHRFAEQAADVFWRQGRKVRLVFPVEPFDDFNDVITRKGIAA